MDAPTPTAPLLSPCPCADPAAPNEEPWLGCRGHHAIVAEELTLLC